MDSGDYLKTLNDRAKKSHVYKKYQMIGLMLADILEDNEHKSLYIKISKEVNNQKLMEIAKKVAEKKDIERKGAYFMKILKKEGILDSSRNKKNE